MIDRESLKIWDRLVTLIERATVDNNALKQDLGREVIKQVSARTRRGIGVVKKVAKPFKPLKGNTIRKRRSLQKRGKLSPETSPTKSNMTESGELVKSLREDVIPTGVNVTLEGTENKRKARNNPDRILMDVTKEEEQALTNMVAKEIVKALKKF